MNRLNSSKIAAVVFVAVCGIALAANAVAQDIVTKPIRTFIGHTSEVYSVAFSPDGSKVLTGSWDSTARLWNAATGEHIRTFSGHTSGISSVAFSPDGSKVLTGSWDNTARLWNAATGEHIRTFSGHTWEVISVAFSPDGSKVLTGSWDSTARLWNADTGEHIRTFSGHTDCVTSVAFSPDGSKVLTGSWWDYTARLWNAATGEELRTFWHPVLVTSVAFSPDGSKVLTGSWDNTARLWNTHTGEHIRTFSGHTDYVYSVAFSPDGTKVLTGSWDSTARLWNAANGEQIRTFSGHTWEVISVAFSPDGSFVLTGSSDGTAKLWDSGIYTPITIIPAQAYSQQTGNLSLSARVRDLFRGWITEGEFEWYLRGTDNNEIAAGTLAYNAARGQWRALHSVPNLPPGDYTIRYSFLSTYGRYASAVSTLMVGADTVMLSGTVRQAATGQHIEGAQVILLDAQALWDWIRNNLTYGSTLSLSTILQALQPIREPIDTEHDGIYYWDDLPPGGSYVIVAGKHGYHTYVSGPLTLRASVSSASVDISLTVDPGQTLAALDGAVDDLRGACMNLLDYNAELAAQMAKRWNDDAIFDQGFDWFGFVGTMFGAFGGGMAAVDQGIITLSENAFKDTIGKIAIALIGEIGGYGVNELRAFLENNVFPENAQGYKNSAMHQLYEDFLNAKTQQFKSQSPAIQLHPDFSVTYARDVSSQTAQRLQQVIDRSRIHVPAPSEDGGFHGFTLADVIDRYHSLSRASKGLFWTKKVLSGVEIVGGAITLTSAATGVGAGAAVTAYTATQVAKWGKTLVGSAEVIVHTEMGVTFGMGMSGVYPQNNQSTADIFEAYTGLLQDEAPSPFYLKKGNEFSADVAVELGRYGSPETLRQESTVTVIDTSTISGDSSRLEVRCLGVSRRIKGTFNRKWELISSEIAGPAPITQGGSVAFTIPYGGKSGLVAQEHYFTVYAYMGPWFVGSASRRFTLDYVMGLVPYSSTQGITQETTESNIVLSAADKSSQLTLSKTRMATLQDFEPVDEILSPANTTFTTHFTVDDDLFAMNLVLFAPPDATVCMLIVDEEGMRLGYSIDDGVTYTEFPGNITDIESVPVTATIIEPHAGASYSVTVSLLASGTGNVPVNLFFNPVPHVGPILSSEPSVVVLDGSPGTERICLLELGEGSEQNALENVSAQISEITQWNATETLPVEGEAIRAIGALGAGETAVAEWTVSFPRNAERGKYTGAILVNCDQTTSFSVPVVAVVRHSTETIGFFNDNEGNPAYTSAYVDIGPDGTGTAYLNIPGGHRVLHAMLTVIADTENPSGISIDIGADGTAEWIHSGPLQGGATINHVEEGFNRYLAQQTHSFDQTFVVPIKVTASPGERIMLDGMRVYIDTLPGDATGNCRVGMSDLIFIRGRLGHSRNTTDNWRADVNNDDVINILDLVYVRNRLGTRCE